MIIVGSTLSEFCRYDEKARSLLQEAGFMLRENPAGKRPDKRQTIELLRDCDAVLAGVEPYDEEVLQALPRLRCISRCGMGTDSIDMHATSRRNIGVFATTDEVVRPVAEMTVAMVFALARRFPLFARASAVDFWKKHTGRLLSELVVGLVGYGRIGREVERCLVPLVKRILVYDPYVDMSALSTGVEPCAFDALLKNSDIVTLHVNRPASDGVMIGEREFALMRQGAYLVNTARGHLVDEEALIVALKSGWLAGAALDVYAQEPYSGPLLSIPQVLCVPHVATLTVSSRIQMETRCALNVIDFFTSQRLLSGSLTGRGVS